MPHPRTLTHERTLLDDWLSQLGGPVLATLPILTVQRLAGFANTSERDGGSNRKTPLHYARPERSLYSIALAHSGHSEDTTTLSADGMDRAVTNALPGPGHRVYNFTRSWPEANRTPSSVCFFSQALAQFWDAVPDCSGWRRMAMTLCREHIRLVAPGRQSSPQHSAVSRLLVE